VGGDSGVVSGIGKFPKKKEKSGTLGNRCFSDCGAVKRPSFRIKGL